jgi:phosphonatase-like hydrolase
MRFEIVLFDVIGTTILENEPDVINRCFEQALLEHGVQPDAATVQNNRGKNKLEIIDEIIRHQQLQPALREKIFQSFNHQVKTNLDQFSANAGAEEIFQYIRNTGLRIGLGSGLNNSIVTALMNHVQWNTALFDYIGTADTVAKGRPRPDMILDLMKKLRITDSTKILKVGDTVSDIQEGKNAGAVTASILSGTQPEEKLRKEKPDFVIQRLEEIKQLI